MFTALLGRCKGGVGVALLLSAVSVWANPPNCPWWVPPSTTTQQPISWRFTGDTPQVCSYSGSQCPSSANIPGRSGAPLCASQHNENGSTACSYTNSIGVCMAYYSMAVCAYGCPSGYVVSGGGCALSDPNAVACPGVTCTSGETVGQGTFTVPEAAWGNPICRQGCLIDTDQAVAGGLHNGDGTMSYGGTFKKTGGACTPGQTDYYATPVDPNNVDGPTAEPKYLCLQDAHGDTYCQDRQKPGCGTVNGKEYCADQFPATSGKCIYFGDHNFVCSSSNPPNKSPPVDPLNHGLDNPPIKTVDIKLPGNGIGGGPGAGPGPWNGNVPGHGGYYPGPLGYGDKPGGDGEGNQPPGGSGDGNGTDTGSARETTQQGVLGKLGEIYNKLNDAGSGSGPAFVKGPVNAPSNSKSAEIQAAKDELSAKMNQIKAEAVALLSFGGGGGYSCPSSWSFTFNGQNMSMCPDFLMEKMDVVAAAVIFMATVMALFIVLR